MHVLVLRAFFPIPSTDVEIHKEHLAIISDYWRNNGVVNVEAWSNTSHYFDRNWPNCRTWEKGSVENECFHLISYSTCPKQLHICIFLL